MEFGHQKCVFSTFFLGKLTENTPSTITDAPKRDSTAVTLPQPTTPTAGSNYKQSPTAEQPVNTPTQQATTTSTTSIFTTTLEAARTSSKPTHQPNKTPKLGRNAASTTVQSSRTGKKSAFFAPQLTSFKVSFML